MAPDTPSAVKLAQGSESVEPPFVWAFGQRVPKSELADVLARKAKQQPLVPCKWRGIFRGGGE